MLSDGTFVRHRTEGYEGVIDGTTSMKELFTGNVVCDRQYRVKLLNSDLRKVAPEEDLVVVEPPALPVKPPPPPDPETKFRDVSFLKAEGYDLEMSRPERQRVLTKVVQARGLYRVVSFILRSLMYNRTKDVVRAKRYERSLNEWNEDVVWMMQTFTDHKEYAATRTMLTAQIKELGGRGYRWME